MNWLATGPYPDPRPINQAGPAPPLCPPPRPPPRPAHRRGQVALPKHDAVPADLGVLVGAEVVEGALRPVPDLPAMLDVEQARDRPLPVAQRCVDAASPFWSRVHDHADLGILDREPARIDVQRPDRRS